MVCDGEREERGKQDKETVGKTDWTWICTSIPKFRKKVEF
jgi:hypothetical protein